MATKQPRNIEIFNRVTAITLVKLYESFPTPIDLDAIKIGYEACSILNSEEEEANCIMGEIAKDSILFLIEEGFLRSNSSGRHLQSPDFSSVKLTIKGFTLLEKTPDAVSKGSDRKPFAEQLKRAVKKGAKESVSEVIKALFTSAVRLGVDMVVK